MTITPEAVELRVYGAAVFIGQNLGGACPDPSCPDAAAEPLLLDGDGLHASTDRPDVLVVECALRLDHADRALRTDPSEVVPGLVEVDVQSLLRRCRPSGS
jgi:hypothetical protein